MNHSTDHWSPRNFSVQTKIDADLMPAAGTKTWNQLISLHCEVTVAGAGEKATIADEDGNDVIAVIPLDTVGVLRDIYLVPSYQFIENKALVVDMSGTNGEILCVGCGHRSNFVRSS